MTPPHHEPRSLSAFVQRQLITAIEAGQLDKAQQLLDKRAGEKVPAEVLRVAAFQTPPAALPLLLPRLPWQAGERLTVELLDEGHVLQAQPLVAHYGLPTVLTASIRHRKPAVTQALLGQGVVPEPKAVNAARSLPDVALIAQLVDQVPDTEVSLFPEALYDLSRVNDTARVMRIVTHMTPGKLRDHELYLASREAAAGGHVALFDTLVAFLPAEHLRTTYTSALRAAVNGGHIAMVKRVLPHADVNDQQGYVLQRAAERQNTELLQLLAPVADFTVARKDLSAHRKWDVINTLALWAPADLRDEWLKHPNLEAARAVMRAEETLRQPPKDTGRRLRRRS